MSPAFQLGRRWVGEDLDPYLIAEIGVNHEGSIKLAKRLIDEASEGGAHAAKFQTYKADKLASRNSPAYWDTAKEPTRSQHELFAKYDSFGPDEYRELARHCSTRGIDFLSTPFDLDAVELLEPLVPAFKVASADITNVPLLRRVARARKPVLLSTGASTLAEIEFAVDLLRAGGASDIVLLHCVLNYPTAVDDAQLGMVKVLRRVFPGCVVGYSDHVVADDTISALEVATLLGACVLEKHFTHDKSLPGNDHYHAMNRDDLRRFVERAALFRRLASGERKDLGKESAARLHARRSIVSARDIRAGEIFSEDNLIAKRPAHGLSPIHWDAIIGRRARTDIAEDTLLTWDMIA
jgi:N-acetylneuraminate synthase